MRGRQRDPTATAVIRGHAFVQVVARLAMAVSALGWTMRPSKLSVIGAVGRRLVPYLIEATIIPTGLFYLLLATTKELRWALIGALCFHRESRRLLGEESSPH